MYDSIIIKIFKEFDQAEKAMMRDVMDESIINLYKDIHARTIKGEFSQEQLKLLHERAEKSLKLVADVKRGLQQKALDNSKRHKKIQSYLKNSF